MKEFTKVSLAEFNGKDGKPAYVAVNGNVYDVSAHYSNKSHYTAGKDITATFAHSPHGMEMFKHLPKVGTYKN